MAQRRFRDVVMLNRYMLETRAEIAATERRLCALQAKDADATEEAKRLSSLQASLAGLKLALSS
ncbi:hypothetical protein [Cupriavidus agavae]|uniref:Uncharacterized protein n=1 Tax=Cupriavidus agavae TaxID=1001822 RepID=A0A4Q7RPI6_9BURK|nr:hypothetical protein [Cupriavidus agavae]RZT35494.1 hypothetical protein EV147_3943 [Cupriavidus agavae]